MRPILLALTVLLAAAQPAAAHRLKLFATIDGGAIAGYGFFVGGGRPQGAILIVRDAAGQEVYRGATDDRGAFSWRPPEPGSFTLFIDAGDGHAADARIGADRSAGPAPPTPAGPAGTAAAAPGPAGADTAAGCAAGIGSAALADAIDRSVDRAVARQVRPLLEAYAEADGRIRLNDVVGGVGMIVGLAGIALWASGRRRDRPAPPPAGASS